MKPNFPCSGEAAAHKAGEECPACYFCDKEIPDLREVTWTTRNHPVCKSCREELDQVCAERQQADLRALMAVADPRETRASDLLRQPRKNFHD